MTKCKPNAEIENTSPFCKEIKFESKEDAKKRYEKEMEETMIYEVIKEANETKDDLFFIPKRAVDMGVPSPSFVAFKRLNEKYLRDLNEIRKEYIFSIAENYIKNEKRKEFEEVIEKLTERPSK